MLNLKPFQLSLVNALTLIALGGYGYIQSESPSATALIPVVIGILLIAMNKGVKNENKIIKNEPIDLFNNGDMIRDFTYVDDIVNGINIIVDYIKSSMVIKDIYNIGNGRQVPLMEFVENIEFQLQRKAQKNFVPKHPADTQATWSDTSKLQSLGYKSETPIEVGVEKFIEWYKRYYNVN